jgi:hypothetical protein
MTAAGPAATVDCGALAKWRALGLVWMFLRGCAAAIRQTRPALLSLTEDRGFEVGHHAVRLVAT